MNKEALKGTIIIFGGVFFILSSIKIWVDFTYDKLAPYQSIFIFSIPIFVGVYYLLKYVQND